MHTERIKWLMVFVAAVLLGACHDDVYCPCLLNEALAWTPLSYSGNQMTYVSGKDTIRLDCGQPTFSEQRKLPEENLNHCFVWAYLPITMDTSLKIRFEIQGSMAPQSKKIIEGEHFKHVIQISWIDSAEISPQYWSLAFHMDGNTLLLDETDSFMDYSDSEAIIKWQNQIGVGYDSVFKFSPRENSAAPLLYFVPGHGLVQIEGQDGTVWFLLE